MAVSPSILSGTQKSSIIINIFGKLIYEASFVDLGSKLRVVALLSCHSPKMAKIQDEPQKAAHQVAKQPPAKKVKLSRVTSGYGGLMVPLSRVRPSQKIGVFHRCSVKKCRGTDDFLRSQKNERKALDMCC